MKHELRKIAKFGVEMPKSVRNTKLQSLQVLYIIVLRAEIVIFELKMSWKDNPYVMQTYQICKLCKTIFSTLYRNLQPNLHLQPNLQRGTNS